MQATTLSLTGSAHLDWWPWAGTGRGRRLLHGSSGVVRDAPDLLPIEAPTDFSRSVSQFWAGTPTHPDAHR